MSEAYRIDWKEERIDGRPVAMAPASVGHTFASNNILNIFMNYLKGKKCVPFGEGPLVYLTEKDHFVPDVMIVCDHNKIKPNGIDGAPDLVVEVLSPSTMRYDKTYKKDIYAKSGVKEYWLVNPSDKSIEVYRGVNNVFTIHDVYTIIPDWMLSNMPQSEQRAAEASFKCSLFEDLEISLNEVFSDWH